MASLASRLDSWKESKSWFENNYKNQFHYIISNPGRQSQDLGSGCHVKENGNMHDLVVESFVPDPRLRAEHV